MSIWLPALMFLKVMVFGTLYFIGIEASTAHGSDVLWVWEQSRSSYKSQLGHDLLQRLSALQAKRTKKDPEGQVALFTFSGAMKERLPWVKNRAFMNSSLEDLVNAAKPGWTIRLSAVMDGIREIESSRGNSNGELHIILVAHSKDTFGRFPEWEGQPPGLVHILTVGGDSYRTEWFDWTEKSSGIYFPITNRADIEEVTTLLEMMLLPPAQVKSINIKTGSLPLEVPDAIATSKVSPVFVPELQQRRTCKRGAEIKFGMPQGKSIIEAKVLHEKGSFLIPESQIEQVGSEVIILTPRFADPGVYKGVILLDQLGQKSKQYIEFELLEETTSIIKIDREIHHFPKKTTLESIPKSSSPKEIVSKLTPEDALASSASVLGNETHHFSSKHLRAQDVWMFISLVAWGILSLLITLKRRAYHLKTLKIKELLKREDKISILYYYVCLHLMSCDGSQITDDEVLEVHTSSFHLDKLTKAMLRKIYLQDQYLLNLVFVLDELKSTIEPSNHDFLLRHCVQVILADGKASAPEVEVMNMLCQHLAIPLEQFHHTFKSHSNTQVPTPGNTSSYEYWTVESQQQTKSAQQPNSQKSEEEKNAHHSEPLTEEEAEAINQKNRQQWQDEQNRAREDRQQRKAYADTQKVSSDLRLLYLRNMGLHEDASQVEIKKQYRKLCLAWHPDKNSHDTEIFTEKFRELNKWYEVLKND